MRLHVFDLLEMKRHVCSENDVDDDAAELPEASHSTTTKCTHLVSLSLTQPTDCQRHDHRRPTTCSRRQAQAFFSAQHEYWFRYFN